MRTLKFNSIEYRLVDHENVMPSEFQATIFKEDYSMEDIAEDAQNNEEIKIYDDDVLVATYTGYTDMRAISMYAHDSDMVVSIELDNHDVYSMLNDMAQDISEIEDVQDAHSNNISELNQQIVTKVDADVVAETENIGMPSKNSYAVGATFMGSDGNYYKAVATITKGNILVVNGNIEPTNINEEINSIKESEVTE